MNLGAFTTGPELMGNDSNRGPNGVSPLRKTDLAGGLLNEQTRLGAIKI